MASHGGCRPGAGAKKQAPPDATRRTFLLTDSEHLAVKKYIEELRFVSKINYPIASSTDRNIYIQAEKKVLSSEILREHAEKILYDWPEGNDHLEWVISATESEIIDWLKDVE